jgi:hypothetical protein
MHPQPLESLRERLLRAGVAPGHVDRYIGELRDHYDDALREELARGADRSVAEQTAWARLGDAEDLAQSVLARPELRSIGARFPGIVFGSGPVVIWIGTLAPILFALTLLPETSASRAGSGPAWQLAVAYAVCLLCTRFLPVILALAMLAASVRQRLTSHWPLIGAATLALVGGTMSVDLALATATGQKGHVTMASSLIPFLLPFPDELGKTDVVALAEGLVRGTVMLAISLLPYLLWRRRHRLPQAAQ